jgi:serine/threonine protein kinase/Tfp pilus assembly protein PilF
MICPHCASEIEPAEGKCPKCSGAIGTNTVFRERDTEISPVDDASDETRFLSPEDHEETLFAAEGATVIETTASEESGARDEEHGPEDGTVLLDDDATHLLSEDETHLMGEDATLLAGDSASTPPKAKKDTGPLESGQNFGNRYHIIKLLGLGGMGAVYQAWDTELEIVVAIKVIRPEAASDPKMAAELDQRFKRELLLAREVTHKNVVRIHDLGEMEGIKYITMSFIEGEDLSSIIKREGKIPIPQALRITRDVVSGLVVAHEAGVVHRDMKPANIMIAKADSNAYIMDFGIARSASEVVQQAMPETAEIPTAATTTPVHGHTVAGAIVGTFEYMAPEQFRGEVADQRSDLYTMGLILYDMLAGKRRARSAHSAVAEVQKRTKESPPPLREVDPEIPEPLEQLVSHCLETDPNERFQTTAELEAALDLLDDDGTLKPVKRTLTGKLMASVAVVFIALLAGTFWFARTRAPEEAPEPMSILVADFQNETGNQSFNGALEQALNIAMEGAGFISAYSRPSAQATAEELQPGSSLDGEMAQLISRREGIDVVLAGTLSERGSGYRISVEALDAALEAEGAKPLAKASANAKSRDDVLPAVGRLASDLRERLGDIEPESARLAATETFTAASLEAMNAYANAQNLLFQGQFDEALAQYEEAVALDPEFGRAYSGMAVVYANKKDYDKAEESYEKALQQLDRMTERERYRTLGTYYLDITRNNEKAIENYEKLVELYPADRTGHANLALAYLYARNFDRAVEEGRMSIELDPKNILQRTNYSMYLMYAGDFQESVAQAATVLEQNPSYGYALFTLARSAVGDDELETAREAYSELRKLGGFNADLATIGEADLEMYLGRYAEAAGTLESALAEAEEGAGNASVYLALAEAYQALGRTEEARQMAGQAVESSSHESVLYPAARVLIALGDKEAAEQIALDLENKLQSHTVSYARLIQGEIALSENRLLPALEAFQDGRERNDSWLAHYLLGRAYLEAEHYAEALGEFQTGLEREGEILDVFLVDGSTIRYLPPTYYYLGRAQEGLGDGEAARESYKKYLDLRTQTDFPDPLAADASNRWSSLGLADAG